VWHRLDTADRIPLPDNADSEPKRKPNNNKIKPDKDAATSSCPGDGPEQRAALDDVGFAASGGGAQVLVALVGLGVGAKQMAEP
jgi:hypothetical protein